MHKMAKKVKEGTTSYHTYEFLDSDDVQVPSVESARYKLSSARGILIDWTDISGTAATGTIEIASTYNVMNDVTDIYRYLTIEATHNGGDKISDEEIYTLVPLKGI